MADQEKTRQQLQQELDQLRRRISDAERQNNQPADEAAFIRHLSQTLLERRTLDAILTTTVTEIQDALHYYHVQIYLSSDPFPPPDTQAPHTEEHLILREGSGPAGAQRKSLHYTIPLSSRRSVVAQAAQSREVVIVNDTRSDHQFLAHPLLPNTRAEAAFPLYIEAQLLGVLDIQHDVVAPFTPAQIDALTQIAQHLTDALVRTRLARQNERLNKEINLLHEVITLQAEDQDALIAQITQLFPKILPVANYGIRLIDPESGNLHHHPSFHQFPHSSHNIRVTYPGEGIAGRVITTGQPRRIGNVRQEPAFTGDPMVRSKLCVPLLVKGKVIGLIDLESVQINAFDAADERLVTTLARRLTSVMEKERLAQQINAQVAETSALLDVTKSLSAVQLDSVLNSIARQIKDFFQADGCRIHLIEKNDLLHCVVAVQEESIHPGLFDLKVGQGIIGRVALSGVPKLIDDVSASQAAAFNADAETLAVAPLTVRQRNIGVLTISRQDTTHPFQEKDLDLLTLFAEQAAIAIENARLFAAEKRQLDALSTLHAVATAVADSRGEDELLEQATRLIGQAFHSDHYGIMLLDGDYQTLSTSQFYRGGKGLIPLENSIAGRAIKTKEPQRIADVDKDESFFRLNKDTRSELCAPLLVGDEVVGVINVESVHPNAFNEADEQLMLTFAQQVATAVEKIRLFEKESRQTERQRFLAEQAGEILGSLNLNTLWSTVTTAIQEVLGAERTAVFVYDDNQEEVTCIYSFGLSQTYIDIIIRQYHLAPGSQLLQYQHPVAVNDIADNPATSRLAPYMLREGFKAYAVFPLTVSDLRAGAIVAYRNEKISFSDEDLATGQTLAHIISTALQNIQLFSEKSLALIREQQLHEVTRTINSALNLPTILAAVARMTCNLVGAEIGAIGLKLDDYIMTFYPYNLPDGVILSPAARGSDLAWEIVESGQSLYLENYINHPQANKLWRQIGIQVYLGIPITTGDQILGVLILLHTSPHKKFKQRDIALVESVSRQAGIAIQNARLYATIQERADVLAATLAKQEELDQLKDLFIQNVSHELRTPLGIIHGHAELLETGMMGQLQPNQLKSVQIIARRVRMLIDLVNDLTAILAAQTQEFRRERISPPQLIKSMMADFQLKAEEQEINLEADIREDVPDIAGDPTHLRRVLDNLVSNAFKFTPGEGKVSLRLWSEANEVMIEVSDSGIGIPRDQLERIFERFYQVDGTSTRRFGGTGLGLALVKEIIEAHHGRVVVDSTEDKGSTFTISLPGLREGDPVDPPSDV